MCLAIPVKVVKITGTLADVELDGVCRQADIRLVDNVAVDDYVLMHAGFAIDKINEKEAKETLKLLKQITYE